MTTVIVATAYGGPEVLSAIERAVPEPGRGEVTIQVRAAAVNPLDILLYSGAFGDDPDRLPLLVGHELAGVVTAAGPDAVGPAGPVRVGDEVIAYPRDRAGAHASEVTWPARGVVPKPPGLGWAEASGLLLAGCTAVHALAATGVADGDTVLIHGVAGSVGRTTAQLAVKLGARVIGTAATERHERLRALGVEPVRYGPDLAERVRRLAPAGVDAAVDAVGTDEAIEVSLELVPDRARVATLVAFQRGNEAGIRTLGAAGGATDAGTEVRSSAWSPLTSSVTDGSLHVVVTATFPLREAAAAHRLVAAGHAGGKVVLLP